MRRALAIVLGLAALAHADPAHDKPRADGEASAAQHLYEDGKFHAAAEHFALAYQLDPQPAYLFDIAQAYRFAKECANAARYYRQFLDIARQLHAQNLDKVQRYLDEMEACATPPPPSPPPSPSPPPPPPSPALSPPPASPLRSPSPSEDRGAPERHLGLALGAAGVVGIAVGAYYTHRVSALHDEAQSWVDAHCTTSSQCDAGALMTTQQHYQDLGNTAEQREVIFYVAGGAAIAGGIVLYLLGRGGDEHAVAAMPTRGGAIVTTAFTF